MTIYLDQPLMSCKERDNLQVTVVTDVVSFIHLVRLNIPVSLRNMNRCVTDWGKHFQELRSQGHYCPELSYDREFLYIPKKKNVVAREWLPADHNYYSEKEETFGLPEDWDVLLRVIRLSKGVFAMPHENRVNNVLSGVVTLQDVLNNPRGFAPSSAWKATSATIFTASDLPFEIK